MPVSACCRWCKPALTLLSFAASRHHPLSLRTTTSNVSAPPETLSGLIERVTFFNEDNGFAVLKVNVQGRREPVAVVCNLAAANAGEWITAEGQWVRDKEFGQQFKASLARTAAPTTREGIEKYLGSGMVKGIGPVYAKKLVAKFGERIFDIIDHDSARLESVEGIGPERRRRIKAAWAEQRVIRERGKSGRNVKALSFHSLRHSFASLLANAGVSEERRMMLTGHVTRDVHQRYSHHDLQRLRDAVAVLPTISTGGRS